MSGNTIKCPHCYFVTEFGARICRGCFANIVYEKKNPPEVCIMWSIIFGGISGYFAFIFSSGAQYRIIYIIGVAAFFAFAAYQHNNNPYNVYFNRE